MLRILTRVLIMSILVGFSACTDSKQREARYIQQAQELFDKGNYAKAGIAVKNVLQINAKNPDALYLSSLIAENNNEFRSMFEYLNAVVEQDPKHIDAHLKLGKLYVLNKQLEKASEIADGIIDQSPEHPDARALRGAILLQKGDKQAAEKEARAVLALEPGNVTASALMAGIYNSDGRSDKALGVIDSAIKLNPKDMALHLSKMQLHHQRGEPAEEQQVVKDLIALYPQQTGFRFGLAKSYAEAGKIDEAEKVIRETVSLLADETEPKLNLIRFLRQHRDVAAAEKALNAFIAEQPDNYALRLALGELLNEQPDRAKAVYQAIVADDENGDDGLKAHTRLARLAITQGRADEARSLVQTVLTEDASNGDALLVRAGLWLKDGETNKAVTDLRRLVRDQPDSEPALRLLARAHLQNDNIGLAQKSLERVVLEVNPRNMDARRELARLLIKRDEMASAVTLLTSGLALSPNDLPTTYLLIELYKQRKDWKNAEKFAKSLETEAENPKVAHYMRATILQEQEKFDEAIAEYNKVLESDPDAVEPMAGIVKSYLAQKKIDKAVVYLNQRISAKPDNAYAYQVLGEVMLYQKKDTAEAGKLFRKVLDIDPKVLFAYTNLAKIHFDDKRLDEAMAVLLQGLETLPSQPYLLLALAELHQQRLSFAEAINTYEQLLVIDPKNKYAANNMAALIADYQQDNKSLKRAREITEAFRQSDDPAFLDTYAWVRYRLKQPGEAITSLEKAVRKEPKIPDFHYHLGMAYLAKGRKAEAKGALEKAITAGKEIPFAGMEDVQAALKDLQATSNPTPDASKISRSDLNRPAAQG